MRRWSCPKCGNTTTIRTTNHTPQVVCWNPNQPACHNRGTIMQPDDHTTANMRYGMPASWEDMLTLGLDPTTGEPA